MKQKAIYFLHKTSKEAQERAQMAQVAFLIFVGCDVCLLPTG